MAKKIVATLLAVATMLCMVIPASATVDLTSHTFEAYQIFTGSYNDGKLEDIQWADGVDSAAINTALGLASDATAAAAAEKIAAMDTETAQDFAATAYAAKGTSAKIEGTGSLNLENPGWYVIVDTTDVSGKVDAKNLTLTVVTEGGVVTPTVKTDVPSFEKKLKDTNDSTGETTDWQDSADYDIGDTIPYKLTATLGDLSKYDTYYLEFTDTMNHLTLVDGSVQVKIGGENGTTLDSDQYTMSWDASTKKLSVVINDVKKAGASSNDKVVVLYNATLDADAVIGSVGNPNTANLEFSNNPNNSGDGSTKPDTGKTPDDTCIVFTYKVTADKYADKVSDSTKLTGAGFTLYKKNASGEYEAVGTEVKGEAMTNFAWTGIDDGDYKLVETTVPAGYKQMDDMTFTVTADHDVLSDNPKLNSLSAAGKQGSSEVTLEAVKNDGSITGELHTNIVNHSGQTLPSTGGMGTTIFYVVGGVLMAAAFVLLITKKRMSHEG